MPAPSRNQKRFLLSADAGKQVTAVVEGIDVTRRDRKRLLIARQGFGETAEMLEGIAAIVMERGGVAGPRSALSKLSSASWWRLSASRMTP